MFVGDSQACRFRRKCARLSKSYRTAVFGCRDDRPRHDLITSAFRRDGKWYGPRLLSALIVCWIATADCTPAHALERVVRIYDERDGLTVAETSSLAQDTRGFLWIGTIGGLTRFDGTSMRPWAPEQIRHVVHLLTTGPSGEVVAAGLSEPLWSVTASGVEVLPGPRGEPVEDWVSAAFSQDDAFWYASRDTLWRRAPDGTWRGLPKESFGGARFFRLSRAPNDSVFVSTREWLWIAGPNGTVRPVAPIPLVLKVEPYGTDRGAHPDRSTDPDTSPSAISSRDQRHVVATADGHLYILGPEGWDPVDHFESQSIAGMAVRGSTIFVTSSGGVLSVVPGRAPEVVAPRPGLPGGRPLLVDHEGTLWIGGLRGLIALAEPSTVAWNETDGFPEPAHAHHLVRTAEGVWTVTWAGTTFTRFVSGEPRTFRIVGGHSGRIRADAHGNLWAADLDRGFICYTAGDTIRFPLADLHGLYGSTPRPDGGLWLATEDGLFYTDGTVTAPRRVKADPPAEWEQGWDECWMGPVLVDRTGRLRIARGSGVWSCDAESLSAGHPVRWLEEPLPVASIPTDMIELDTGQIWLGTTDGGVLEKRDTGWAVLPGNEQLGSLRIYGLVPSPSGGAWVLTAGTVARVIARPDTESGWEMVERITPWHGLPTQQAGDLHEDADGKLWLATLAGLTEVPPEARFARMDPPLVELVDVRVDGERLPLDRAVELPARRNRLELHFAALSYRDRSQLHYQVRLREGSPWRDSGEPVFRFVDLSPGDYQAQVRASLDGMAWSETPAAIVFSVARPWWQMPWAIAVFVLSVAIVLYGLHRLRVGVLLRLERQRLRIAMDLHDEVGSGLGSIGILAGLAADERLDREERRLMNENIGATAADLGAALGDLVGSLRRGGMDTVESFARRLAARAKRIVPGETPQLELRFDLAGPPVRLEARVQRELQALAAEALHNAVRHASARRVELGLAPEGDAWHLWVKDDGEGISHLEASALPGGREQRGGAEGGNGLRNMTARAASIGGVFRIESSPGRGTVIHLRFRADGRRMKMREPESSRT